MKKAPGPLAGRKACTRTLREAEGYRLYLEGLLALERNQWNQAKATLEKCSHVGMLFDGVVVDTVYLSDGYFGDTCFRSTITTE